MKKIFALHPDVREEECDHAHTPYRARWGMPCTGPLVCTMCGTLFDPETKQIIQEGPVAESVQASG